MNDMDQLERLIGRELHDRADGLGGTPLGFDDVRGKAVRIRRNRRIAGGVAVAAAFAVVVPTVMAVTGSVRTERELDPAPSPDKPAQVVRTSLTLDGLERGEDSGVEYFTPDGPVVPGHGLIETDLSYQALVPSEADGGPGGWIAVEPDGQHLRVLTADFEPQSGSSKTGSFVTDTDRDHYAYVATEAGAQTLVSKSTTDFDDATTWDLPASGLAEVVGYLGDDRLVVENTDQTDGSVEVLVAEPNGSLTPVPGYVGAQSTDETNGLLTVQTAGKGQQLGCFAVIDPDAPQRKVWETCSDKLGDFSPDGRYVMSTNIDSDGFGLRTLNVLDAATGDLVTSFTQGSRGAIDLVHPTWETSESVITVAAEGETVALLRLALDGTVTEAAERTEGPYGDLTFYLGQDRRGL